jgi:hypothetical protein
VSAVAVQGQVAPASVVSAEGAAAPATDPPGVIINPTSGQIHAGRGNRGVAVTAIATVLVQVRDYCHHAAAGASFTSSHAHAARPSRPSVALLLLLLLLGGDAVGVVEVVVD